MNKTKLIFSIVYTFGLLLLQNPIFAQKPSEEDSSKYNINNCSNTFNAEKAVKTSAGYQYWFIDKDFLDGRTLKMSVVKPHGATHKPHSHTDDEIIYILEGEAEIYLGGETKVIGPNTSFYLPPIIEHAIRNAGNTDLKYLVIRKYEE